jgi:hypothetical protein
LLGKSEATPTVYPIEDPKSNVQRSDVWAIRVRHSYSGKVYLSVISRRLNKKREDDEENAYMSETSLRIRMFKPVADGYLLAFAAEGSGRETTAAEKEAALAIAALNPWQRRWLLQEHAWWIADDAITLLARRLPALSELLEQWLRRSPEADGSFWSYILNSSMYSAPHIPPAVAEAYSQLGLQPGAPDRQVLAARRQLARRHHPDRGGELARMTALNSATDTVRDWLRRGS